MQGKLGHTSTLHCLAALLLLSFGDSRGVCMQGSSGTFSNCLMASAFLSFSTSKPLCIQGKLGCTSTLKCLLAPSFSLHPQQVRMHAFECLSCLCRGICSARGNGNPFSFWEKRESIKSLQLHENQSICLLVDRVSLGGPQVARC